MCFFRVFPKILTTWLRSWTVMITLSDTCTTLWTPKTLLTLPDPCTCSWTPIHLTIWILVLWTARLAAFDMTSSARSCCIPGCGKTRADNVVLHGFPDPIKDKERFVTWVNAVGSSISSLDHKFIHENRKICHNHFEEKYLTWSRKLSYGAVPTLGMPGFKILRDITNFPVGHYQHERVAATSSSQLERGVASGSGSSSSQVKLMAAASYPNQELATDKSAANVIKGNISEPENPVPPKSAALNQSSNKSRTKGNTFKEDRKALAEMLKKITKKKDHYAARLKKAMVLSENLTFKKIMAKFTTLATIFFTMQFREVGKHKMGRRFTKQEKIMALSFYKKGPRCYRLLSKAFVLPSPLTLSRFIAQANLKAGINEKLFKVLLKKTKQFQLNDNLCTLLFDEIAITPHFDYNSRKDEISGFVNNGTTKGYKIADHALVFMIRGVSRNYKQPVAYSFCSGSTKKEELAMLLTQVIRKLHSVGFKVLTTVCDQGASNVSCINYLIANTKAQYLRKNEEHKRQTFEIDGEEVIPLYDPPHLIKGIRNNLIEKDLKCTIEGSTKIAKWEHLRRLYAEDPEYKGIRLLKKLTNDHINPEKCKMKVKFATQVFSQQVGCTMGYFAKKHILPEECTQTADVIIFFDELFDSVNGSHDNSEKRSGKPLLRAVTPASDHNALWAKAKKIFNSMKFIKNNKEVSIPSVNNWLHTIQNMEYLRDVLFHKYNIKSIWMRHFNQDPLENFFGSIRSHGCRNVSPTPEGFEFAFASLIISNLTSSHSPGTNCEKDSCQNLFNSMEELFKSNEKPNTSQEIDLSYMETNIFVDYDEKTKEPRILSQLEYVAGYILRKTKKNVFTNCVTCKNNFYSPKKDSEYLMAREYDKKKQYLVYPKKEMVKMFSVMQDILIWVLKKHSNIENIKLYAKTIMSIEINIDFNTCSEHKQRNTEYIFDLVCRFFIFNWCKDVNNILKGRKSYAFGDDAIKNLALEYTTKRKKK